jgi:DNA-binding SARP family transcriptional activator
MAARAAERLAAIRSESRSGLTIQSLGGFRVLRGGEPVPLGEWQSRKARDLLKILVARRGRPITREAMCEALWPDEDAGPLANRLSVALTTVRTVLDPDRALVQDHFVRADKTTIALETERLTVDLEAFHADADEGRRRLRRGDEAAALQFLAAAESAYLGPFLEGDPAEEWATAAREQAAAEYVWVARSLAALMARRGDIDGATRLQLRILDLDPYDEPAHLDLVALLARVGRHGDARRRYEAYAERMGEIGIEVAAFPAQDRQPTLVA